MPVLTVPVPRAQTDGVSLCPAGGMHVRWAEKLTQRMTKLMHRKEGGWESGAAVVRAVRAACAQLNAIEKQYAGSLSKQGGAGGASSSSLSVKNFGAGGASSQEQTCQGCAEGCDECEAGASAP